MHQFIKVFFPAILTLLFSHVVFADPVIELDNQNAARCIQQISSVQDEFPVVLIYEKQCPYAKIFLPTYQSVSSDPSQQGRAFFEYDFSNEQRDVLAQCLGLDANAILASPTVTVILQMTDPETGKNLRSMPLRAWGGTKTDPTDPSKFVSISPEELEHIIDLTDVEKLRLKNMKR